MEKKFNRTPVCEFYEVCPFFRGTLADMPSTADVIKRGYCCSPDYKACARYVVTMEVGVEHVMDSLFPNNAKKAEEIILREKGSGDNSDVKGN